MYHLTRMVFIAVFSHLAFFAWCNPGKKAPASTVADSSISLTAAMDAEKKPAKICSCQIMDMQSNNYRHIHLAVFAEKTWSMNWKKDLKRTNNLIEKEKKHLKDFFYDRLNVTRSVTEFTDCKTLYARLRFYYRPLVIYDILDADSRR